MKPHLQFGYVARAHGLDGEVVVKTFDPASQVFDEIECVFARLRSGEERRLAVAEVRSGAAGEVLVRFKKVNQRKAAEALKGAVLMAFRDDLEPCGAGEVFSGDLQGLEAFTPEGVRLGVVEELWSTGPVPNLVIREGEQELMIPFVDDFVKLVDVAGGRVVVTPLAFEE